MNTLRPAELAATALSDLASRHALEVVAGSASDIAVTGVSMASDDVAPGDLFIGVPGAHAHGARFAAQALERGAVALLTDAAGVSVAVAAGLPPEVPVLVTTDPRAMAGAVSADVYAHPGRDLRTMAVTGTNGKTTTLYFLDAIARLGMPDAPAVLLGTVELKVGEEAIPSPRTTVEAPVLHRLLRLGLERGARAASVEVSSHALVLGRVNAWVADVVGFTNLQRDHLDFHHTMEQYLQDKAILFTPEHARRGVVCVDDEWGQRLAETTTIEVDRVRAFDGDAEADWWISEAAVGLDSVATTFVLNGPQGERLEAVCPLPGRVNLQNAALAIVMGLRAGYDEDVVLRAIASAHHIPGRMQRISDRVDGRPLAIVDFAHTPDALELALSAVRPITPGRLIAVYGSDGDRDQGKRPMLGEVGARLADILVITDENPRSEDPATIRSEVLAGVRSVRGESSVDVHEAHSRADAIAYAVSLAGPQDTIIVTGKGHEPHQEIAGVFHPYNDAPVMREALVRRWGAW